MSDLLQELIDKVVQWGHDRNLNAPENLKAQTMKLVSEFGEIGTGLVQNDDDEVIDGIGDVLVVAIILSAQLWCPLTSDEIESTGNQFIGLEFANAAGRLGLFVDAVLKGNSVEQCSTLLREFVQAIVDFCDDFGCAPEVGLEAAYNEIKDRKGVMYQGAFIKESDPRYADALRGLGRE